MEYLETKDFNYVSNINQIKKLEEAKQSLIDVENGLKNNLPIDMIEIDIKLMWEKLGEIIGENYSDSLIDQLFSNFCVGK